MCDYCGCRTQGPTAELHLEHQRLEALGDEVRASFDDGTDPARPLRRLVHLLELHAAKEEIGLFAQVEPTSPLAEQISVLCREHDDLRAWLGHGPSDDRVGDGLRLLLTHIEDEEYDLFPHILHRLDPEQWDEVELAHRAIDAVWEDITADDDGDACDEEVRDEEVHR